MPNPKRINQIKYLTLPLFATIILFFSTSLTTMAQGELTLNVKAGLDSYVKEDMAMPLLVTIDNQGPALDAELQIVPQTNQQREDIFTIPVELPSQSRKQIPVHLLKQNYPRLVVHLVDPQGEIRTQETVNFQKLMSNEFLAGVVSSNGSLLNSLAALRTASGQRVAVAHLDIADLPETLQAWYALDMLVFNDIDSALLSTVQRDLLRHWLYSGGRLVIGGGPNAGQTLAGLSNVLPYEAIENIILPHPIPELDQMQLAFMEDRGPYTAAKLSSLILSSPQGESIVTQYDLPLITSLRRGEGEVIYSAFDLNLAPMDNLLTQTGFLTQFFGQLMPIDFLYSNISNRNLIVSSLSTLPNFSLPHPWTVIFFLFLYIVCVGPLNYLLLRRIKKREWMWGTIPLIILIFCAIGYARGYALKGDQTILRQLTVISGQANNSQVISTPKQEQDAFEPSGPSELSNPFESFESFGSLGFDGHIGLLNNNGQLQRPAISPLFISGTEMNSTAYPAIDGTLIQPEIDSSLAEYGTFIGLFSTERAKYKMTIDDATLVQPFSPQNQDLNISYGAPTMLTDLYVDIGSMPILLARGQLVMPDIGAQLHYEEEHQSVQGSIFNNTGRPIDGTYLLYGNRGLSLGHLAAGETTLNGRIDEPIHYDFRSRDSSAENLRWVSRSAAISAISQQTIPFLGEEQALYLMGWQENSPVQAALPDDQNQYMADTLLFIRLSQ